MSRVVAKFGGTSVKTASAIRMIAGIVTANTNIKVVVVSAVGGVTNMLVEFCNANNMDRGALIERMISLHIKLSEELGLDLQSLLKEKFLRLNSYDKAVKLSAKDVDHILSLGEDLSALIVSEYLNANNLNCTYLDAREFMQTDSNYGKALPKTDMIKTYQFPENLTVTQGFIGRDDGGCTTTLGRGGSDYSAALIAEAITADELLIYTDVPGVYTMDPNRVNTARLITELSFQEMAEMANFGAKILHPATLAPCVRSSIPIRILSTFEPMQPGTLIRVNEDEDNKSDSRIRAITMRKGQVLVTIKSLEMLNVYGFLANIFSVLANHKISVDLITTSEVSVALTIDVNSVGSHGCNPFIEDQELLADLGKFGEVVIEEGLTLIAVIGGGLTIPGAIQSILGLMNPNKIRLICYGASNSSVGILVPHKQADEIVSTLHALLIGGQYV